MTCINAQNAIMLYHEKRIKPIKSVLLHRHLKKCRECEELFLEMDTLQDIEIKEAPAMFEKSVMNIVRELPALKPAPLSTSGFYNYVMPVLALVLAAVLAVLYNTELAVVNYTAAELPVTDIWGRVHDFSHGLLQTGQNILSNFIDMISINFVFVMAVAMAMTAIGIDMGKQTEA